MKQVIKRGGPGFDHSCNTKTYKLMSLGNNSLILGFLRPSDKCTVSINVFVNIKQQN